MDTPLFDSYLLELLIKSTLVLLAAAAIAAALHRSSAARRHAVWLAALIALLILPLTKAIPPIWQFSGAPVDTKVPVVLPTMPAVPAEAAAPIPTQATASISPSIWFRPSQLSLATLWAAGIAGILIFRGVAGIQLRLVRKRSVAAKHRALPQFAQEVAGELNLPRIPEVRASDAVQVACAAGFGRPFVLLPFASESWPEERLRATLRHEFAHIVRRDSLSRWIGLIACAVYWPNPLVWFAARRLHREQEQSCDDLAIRAGTNPEEYATVLLETARDALQSASILRASMAMGRPATLEERVIAVVDENRDRSPTDARARCMGGAGVLILVAASALAQAVPAIGTPETSSMERPIPIEIYVRVIEMPVGRYLGPP
jgi:beta-lactamase regulating signal transducer with metallopeptidase domain